MNHLCLVGGALTLSCIALSGCATNYGHTSEIRTEEEKPVAANMDDLPEKLDPKTQQPGLTPGERAPNARLVNVEGDEVELDDLWSSGPTVVTFYRGSWCPFCTKALSRWQDKLPDLEEAGGQFVAISPETREHSIETVDMTDATYLVLSDSSGEAIRNYRVAFELEERTQKKYRGYGIDLEKHNQIHRWELPAPATFVVDRDGVVRWAFAEWDYKKRAKPKDVIEFVEAMNK